MPPLIRFFSINRVIAIFIVSEFVLTTSFGLLVPIMSLFIVTNIEGGSPRVAGFFGGTSLLIVVGVTLDTMKQIESHLLMRHYEGFFKTGRLKGRR